MEWICPGLALWHCPLITNMKKSLSLSFQNYNTVVLTISQVTVRISQDNESTSLVCGPWSIMSTLKMGSKNGIWVYSTFTHSGRPQMGFVNLDIANTQQNGGVCMTVKWTNGMQNSCMKSLKDTMRDLWLKTPSPVPKTLSYWAQLVPRSWKKSILWFLISIAPLFEKTDIGTQWEEKEQFPSLYNYLCFLPPLSLKARLTLTMGTLKPAPALASEKKKKSRLRFL